MACLDTSALLDLSGRGGEDRRRRARAKVRELAGAGEELVTTRFNLAELWVGIARSENSAAERDKVRTLLAPLAILEFDARGAEIFGRVQAELQKRGESVGDMDALIAAVSLVEQQVVVTRDTSHFERIPGVSVETY